VPLAKQLWLGDGNDIIWTIGDDDGSTMFAVGDATNPDAEQISPSNVLSVLANSLLC
jgi:hypothetical protein